MKPALVVLSGGQDSTTCLFWAVHRFEPIRAIGFDYGQRHKAELDCARTLCDSLKIPFEVVPLSAIAALTQNALVQPHMPIAPLEEGKDLPNTFVEGRNLLFFSYAAIYAKTKGIKHIITGVSETDFSGYPDCRDVFIKSLNVTLNLAMDYNFVLETPLMWLNKQETWALADQLGVLDIIKEHTLTCYKGIPGDGCGECPACMLRKKGYEAFLEKR